MLGRTWTRIVHDGEGVLVMLSPEGVDMDALGFPDGLRLGGQAFLDEEAATAFAQRVNSMLEEACAHAPMDGRGRDDGGMPPRRDGLACCMVYQDVETARRNGGAGAYLRLILPGVDMQAAGFSHGVSLGGQGVFADKADAVAMGRQVDALVATCLAAARNMQDLLPAPGM